MFADSIQMSIVWVAYMANRDRPVDRKDNAGRSHMILIYAFVEFK